MDYDPIAEIFKHQPDRDFIVLSHQINRELHSKLTYSLRDSRKHDKCTLFLTTFGGDPHAGYRIARCLRHHYNHVRLVVPSYCKSAGTLIAISANELAICDLGELGPLDIQVSKPSEIQERGSGLDIIQALNMALQHTQAAFQETLLQIRSTRLSTRMAGEFASKIAIGVAGPLYEQIDPNKLGEMQRAMQITLEYGHRLNGHSSNLKEGALTQLIAAYPSHSFVIDRKEARELFNRVDHPTKEEQGVCDAFGDILLNQTDVGPIFPQKPAEGDNNVQTATQD